MGEVFRSIKLRDWGIAGGLTVLGVLLMLEDTQMSDEQVRNAIAEGSMVHAQSSHSLWMIPVFAAATIPVLWWRRGILAVAAASVLVMALHDVLFGWVTRCGAGLPLAFVLAFLGGIASDKATAWIVCGLSVVLTVLVLVIDSTTGPSAIILALPIVCIVFGVGLAARRRTALNLELADREAELRQLRDDRAALEVADDRARLSRQLDGLLQERLAGLTTAAESANGLPPAEARAVLESIESGSRQTLDDMREIVGLLRGDDIAFAPTPTVAHLDTLLARLRTAHSQLVVTGDPRALPATVELSAYRIVEHLVTALADQADAPIVVTVRFEDDALEIRVNGQVGEAADLKAAVVRAKERAKLLGGSVDVKVSKGRAGAVAQLPVVG
ncbi:sensor histidine kinase [Kribbella kalugense]|uniref:histidine kinase n=1 Tax=Kribbella kalugense TaxID=2512221 RepID=A0A4R7ZKJ7_9ACTN|nr:histidine kinase [Kribbella kalugense]TDW18313.1 signal transduction histidine kinase [Kribbella kalugense]